MAAPKSFVLRNWTLAAAAIVLVGIAFMPAPAIGQQMAPPEVGAPPAEAASSERVQGLSDSDKAVSAVGPIEVLEVTPEKLVLATSRKPLAVDLSGKDVTVLDSDGQKASLTAVTPGMSVTVLRRVAGVTIRIVPKQEAKDDQVM